MIFSSLLPLAIAEDNFMEFGNVNFGRDFKEKSKWIIKSGAEYIQYPSSLPEYNGQHEDIKSGEVNDLNGYGLSFGRDFYIGKGFSTTITIGGYYSKTLDKVIGKGAEDIDFDFSQTRTAHLMTSYEASLGLNYIFDYKIVDVQPFIEVGVGAGSVEVEKEYTRVGFSFETNGAENYNVKTKEDFLQSRISLGVNFISYKGLMSYIKASTLIYSKTNRETNGSIKKFGEATETDVSSKEDNVDETESVTMISIGIGRYF